MEPLPYNSSGSGKDKEHMDTQINKELRIRNHALAILAGSGRFPDKDREMRSYLAQLQRSGWITERERKIYQSDSYAIYFADYDLLRR